MDIGLKMALVDENIEGEKFYIEVEVLDVSPKGYIITDKGTFRTESNYIKRVVEITSEIQEEIDKLKLKKWLHSKYAHTLNKLTLIDLQTIKEIFERY